MAAEYSVDVCKTLEERFRLAKLYRPMRVSQYEPGTELTYHVKGVSQANSARVHLIVEKFVGGGFAGQVYKVKVLSISTRDSSHVTRDSSDPRFRGDRLAPAEAGGRAASDEIDGLEVGRVYAMKILIPPSGFSRIFRNLLYWVGFQGPFQLQVNPAAARAGALWQKLIRRGAKIRFGEENTVVDIHATFVDNSLGSCGELSEWVDGRTWRLEVDKHLDLLSRWRSGKQVNIENLGSPEYRAKYEFMHKFVAFLHDMGCYELARQYEWATCKSQPNCLNRHGLASAPVAEAAPATGAGANSSSGLVAVDFRAGLTLLPFLPMSPGDFKLIVKGIMRGSLVQFDRGSISKLEQFVKAHSNEFAGCEDMLDELKAAEKIYRNSVPDLTHNHIRLLYSRSFWSTILNSAITGWKVRNFIDEQHEQKLYSNKLLTLLLILISLIPLFGRFCLKIWGRADWRRHYFALLTSWKYLKRAVQGKIAEKVIVWHRAGRVGEQRANKIANESWRFFCHLPLSILPAGLHRFLTDRIFRREKFVSIFVRPIHLYFNAKMREQWLHEMVAEGRKKQMLSDDDAGVILSQINEPFIQKYLVSLVVHLMTLPVSEIVWIIVALIYVRMHPGLSLKEASLAVGAILVAFQFTPISPGSLIRGFYVLYLIIRERNFKDYNIAVFLGFFKLVGYLAFPIQMTYRYPALARFMAAHWATEAVHIVPVFGESGALLEHFVFRLFYNWPLTMRRRMRRRAEIRASLKPRYWHVGLCVIATVAIFRLTDFIYISKIGKLPSLGNIWWLVISLPLICGAAVTLGCGGTALVKRIAAAAICGMMAGVLYIGTVAVLCYNSGTVTNDILISGAWRIFIITILSTIGAIITELKLPEHD